MTSWSGSGTPIGAQTNILTAAEAAAVLRCTATDTLMLQLLPMVDDYIEQATGRDWAADSTVEPLAKSAAQMLITLWHEDPSMVSSLDNGALGHGLRAALVQLEAKALELAVEGIPSVGLEVLASQPADGASDVSTSVHPLLVFSVEMASGVTSQVALQTRAGAAVAATVALDVTLRRVTITPTSALSALTDYQIVMTAATDIYGRTLTETRYFRTA